VALGLFMLLYDVFMVHITPFFTPNGSSIMVDVAVKPGLNGDLPRIMAFALYFPDYLPSTESTCMGVKYQTVLGLGDLFFAAIIFEYIFTFELVTREGGRKNPPCITIYEIVCLVMYCSSLLACYTILIFTNKPQPALEFIIPFLLISIFVTAAARGEAKLLWNLDYNEYPPTEELLDTVRQELIDIKREVDERDKNQSEWKSTPGAKAVVKS